MSDEGIPHDDLAEQIAMEQDGETRDELAEALPPVARFYRQVADQRHVERDEARAEAGRLRRELRDAHNDLLNIRGILSPNGYEPKTPLPLVPTVAPAVEWLVAELEATRRQVDDVTEHAKQVGSYAVQRQAERDEARAEVQQWQATYGENALRDATRVLQEREEARAEVVRLGRENTRLIEEVRTLREQPTIQGAER